MRYTRTLLWYWIQIFVCVDCRTITCFVGYTRILDFYRDIVFWLLEFGTHHLHLIFFLRASPHVAILSRVTLLVRYGFPYSHFLDAFFTKIYTNWQQEFTEPRLVALIFCLYVTTNRKIDNRINKWQKLLCNNKICFI